MEADRQLDRFNLEVFCQHCGQYLTTLVGVERSGLDAAREHLRDEAQVHANTVGREVEVTYYVTLQRRVFIHPRPAVWAHPTREGTCRYVTERLPATLNQST